jgi:hypothetical protein
MDGDDAEALSDAESATPEMLPQSDARPHPAAEPGYGVKPAATVGSAAVLRGPAAQLAARAIFEPDAADAAAMQPPPQETVAVPKSQVVQRSVETDAADDVRADEAPGVVSVPRDALTSLMAHAPLAARSPALARAGTTSTFAPELTRLAALAATIGTVRAVVQAKAPIAKLPVATTKPSIPTTLRLDVTPHATTSDAGSLVPRASAPPGSQQSPLGLQVLPIARAADTTQKSTTGIIEPACADEKTVHVGNLSAPVTGVAAQASLTDAQVNGEPETARLAQVVRATPSPGAQTTMVFSLTGAARTGLAPASPAEPLPAQRRADSPPNTEATVLTVSSSLAKGASLVADEAPSDDTSALPVVGVRELPLASRPSPLVGAAIQQQYPLVQGATVASPVRSVDVHVQELPLARPDDPARAASQRATALNNALPLRVDAPLAAAPHGASVPAHRTGTNLRVGGPEVPATVAAAEVAPALLLRGVASAPTPWQRGAGRGSTSFDPIRMSVDGSTAAQPDLPVLTLAGTTAASAPTPQFERGTPAWPGPPSLYTWPRPPSAAVGGVDRAVTRVLASQVVASATVPGSTLEASSLVTAPTAVRRAPRTDMPAATAASQPLVPILPSPEHDYGVAPAPASELLTQSASPAPPSGEGARIDIDELVERALQALMLRLDIESERRGFTRWA